MIRHSVLSRPLISPKESFVSITISEVARPSALVQFSAMTEAEITVFLTGYPVLGWMMWEKTLAVFFEIVPVVAAGWQWPCCPGEGDRTTRGATALFPALRFPRSRFFCVGSFRGPQVPRQFPPDNCQCRCHGSGGQWHPHQTPWQWNPNQG